MHFEKIRHILILLLLGISTHILGQKATISGIILDDNNQPIPFANVFLKEINAGNTANTEGVFTIERVAMGDYTFMVSAIGYLAHKQKISVKNADSALVIHVKLTPLEEKLREVVVTGTMKEVSKDASPILVDVFSPRFFQKNPTPNIFEALSGVNGVRPQLNCNVCNTGDIHINGMEGAYTMITIDGMPIVSGLSTVYGLSGIPNGMVERIEVVKGPASTLYGSEAVGGVINIITKNALTAPRLVADAFATSIGEYNLDAAATARAGIAHTLLGVNYFNFNHRLDINQDNFTDIALQNRFSIFNKWQFDRKKDRVATLAARFVRENRWGGELNWTPQYRGTDSIYGENIVTNRVEVLSKYQLPTAKRRALLDASWNWHDQDAYYGTTLYRAQQQVAFAQITTDLPLGKRHDALLGAAVRFNYYDDNTPATADADGVQNRPAKTWLPGLFFQNTTQINAKNQLLLGIRYDYNTAHGHIFTPRASWKWAKNAQQILRFTTGSGYRVANIFTEEHAALTGAREVIIAENLLPERSWNANMSYTQKFYPRGAGFIGLDVALFYTYFSNQITPDYATDPNKIIFANLEGHAVSSGGSLNLDFNFLNGLKIMAGATAMDVFRVQNGIRQPQLFAPPFSATWAVTYPIPKWQLSIDYTGNLNSPMPLPVVPNDPRPDRSPWFAIHNVQITKTFKKGFEIYGGVKNLLGFYPRGEVILRAFDPFDKQITVNNPNGFTFDPTYNYAPIQQQRGVIGFRWKM